MELLVIIDNFKNIIIGAMTNISWLFFSIEINNGGEIIRFSPVLVLSFSVLSALIVVATVKWLIS